MNTEEIEIRVGTVTDILRLNAHIPEFAVKPSRERLERRLMNGERASSSFILVASHRNAPIAYKAGYALNSRDFYSWLGAVLPAHRQSGIATRLRDAQERWAHDQGYSRIYVKSMNRYPAMLRLLISAGYQICAYEDAGAPESSKVMFVKSL